MTSENYLQGQIMRYQLMYFADTQSGFVLNTIYPRGYTFDGLHLKPNLPYEYVELVFNQATGTYFIDLNGEGLVEMTETERIDTLNACTAWVDTTYVPKPTEFSIIKEAKVKSLEARFNDLVNAITPHTPPHEMASWRKQEEQARAWNVDDSVPTPLIDSLLVSRGLDETKSELVAKIVSNADAYEYVYGGLLGAYQKAVKAVDAVQLDTTLTDEAAIEADLVAKKDAVFSIFMEA